jgi:PhoPQ-activated pathogenicity-related protein
MKNKNTLKSGFTLAALSLAFAIFGCAHAPERVTPASTARETKDATALDRYVAKPDPSFSFKLVNTFESDESKGYVLDMISQTWRSPEEVDQPVWKHWVTIAVPKKVTSNTALMVIAGGSSNGKAPGGGDARLHKIAVETSGIVAQVSNIPNEPLVFSDDKKRRNEDSIIAYTWDKYLRTGDEEWPLRLPMTKAVVRAMDAVQTFCASKDGGKHKVENFVVTGASKRGWTTWTTAAVDNRVIGMCPMVIDVLNIVPSFRHHQAVYGGWSDAVGDYSEMGLMDWIETPEYAALMKIVEPYSYVKRYTIPKLVITSCGDQFFLPDSTRFYFDDLTSPKYLRSIPNTGHGLNASVVGSIASFYNSVKQGAPLPQYSWTFTDSETTRVETPDKPISVKLWQATNPEARDFRIDKIGEAYKATELTDQGGGVFVGHVEKPEKGWTAFMVELTFKGPADDAPFTFTSPLRITPDTTAHQYEPIQNPPKGFLSK